MIIYNVTVKIDLEAHDEWIHWMKHKHIAEVMATGVFHNYRMSRMIGLEEDDGITYSVQYGLDSVAQLNDYFQKFAAHLQQEHIDKFKDKFVAYRTVMEVIAAS